MPRVSGPASPLYYRLRLFRRTVPLALSLVGFTYEIVEHVFLARPLDSAPFVGEILLFALIGPVLIFLVLTWLMHRVAERDAAEAQLAALYEVSREIAASHTIDELQDIALSVPERAGLPDAASALIVQEGPGQPWLLARTRGFDEADVVALQGALASRQDQPDCVPSQAEGPFVKMECPLLQALSIDLAQPRLLGCSVALSREQPRRAVMGIYLPQGAALPERAMETLEPLAAGLSLAMDRASFRAHERQLLHQLRGDVVAQSLGLAPTFERILADIAGEHPIGAAAVYLLHREGSEDRLRCTASWPDPHAAEELSESALNSIRAYVTTGGAYPDSEAVYVPAPDDRYTLALPIVNQDETLGVLVLAGQAECGLPHPSVLDVVTGMMALLVRNSELYARLESQAVLEERNHLAREVHDGVAQALGFFNFKVQQVQRLLSRGDLPEAMAALQELRSGSQEVYEEMRRMIRDLRGTPEHGRDLGNLLGTYCKSFAARTGLEVLLQLDPDIELPTETQVELFRVVEEALNNAYRHAQAGRVSVTLAAGANGITLSVEDDGMGIQPGRETGDHFGLQIMHQRVRSVGGEIELVSRNGRGTLVRVRVPSVAASQDQKEELWSALVS